MKAAPAKSIVREAVCILAVALLLSLLANAVSPKGITLLPGDAASAERLRP